MKLTLKQQKFADEYIICGNATEAAKRAGYSDKTASVIGAENLIKPNIKSYIDQRLEALKSEKVADQQEVMEVLTAILRGERSEEVLMMDPITGSVKRMDKKADNMTVIRAGAELMKRYPLPVDINVQGTVVFANEDSIED